VDSRSFLIIAVVISMPNPSISIRYKMIIKW
jgi:hypothetical protein